MAGTVELDIAGLEGNMMAQPRIFAHDAQPLNVADFGDLLAASGGSGQSNGHGGIS